MHIQITSTQQNTKFWNKIDLIESEMCEASYKTLAQTLSERSNSFEKNK